MSDKIKEELLLKCLIGEAEEEEYETAYKWIHSDTNNYNFYISLRDAWIASGIVKNNTEYNFRKAWKRISRRTGLIQIKPDSVPVFGIWRTIAAILIVGLLSSALTYYIVGLIADADGGEYLVEAPRGSKTYMVLPDGSEIWLNAGSTLSYSTRYNIDDRRVNLSGEAFFNVAQNNDKQFSVQASGLVINALGTSFNVKAYPEENRVETIVVTGRVCIETHLSPKRIERTVMKENQRAVFIPDMPKLMPVDSETAAESDLVREKSTEVPSELASRPGILVIEDINNPDVFTSWKGRRLVFDREKISDLVVKLERKYDVNFVIRNEELKQYHLTGSLEEETLEQLLNAIRLAIPMDFEIKNNSVYLDLNRELQKRYETINVR